MNPGSFSANTFYNVQDILLDMVSWGLLVEICELFKFLWRKVKRADVVLLSLLQKEHTDHYFYNSANTISFFFEGAWPLCDILFLFFSFHVRPKFDMFVDMDACKMMMIITWGFLYGIWPYCAHFQLDRQVEFVWELSHSVSNGDELRRLSWSSFRIRVEMQKL